MPEYLKELRADFLTRCELAQIKENQGHPETAKYIRERADFMLESGCRIFFFGSTIMNNWSADSFAA